MIKNNMGRILLINSICCWKSSEMIINFSAKLKMDNFNVEVIVNGERYCSYFNSPLLKEPKKTNCKLNREKISILSQKKEVVYQTIDDYIFNEDYIVANNYLSKNSKSQLGNLTYNNISIWDYIKGTYAKSQLINDIKEYPFYQLCELPDNLRQLVFDFLIFNFSIQRLLKHKNPEIVLIFNGYFFYEALFKYYSTKSNIKVIAFERSFLKNVYYFSETGIVGNRIKTSIISYQELNAINLSQKEIQKIFDYYSLKVPTVNQPQHKSIPFKNYTLFVAQVPFDSVVVYDNPYFKSSIDAIIYICEIFKSLGEILIIKLHPFEGVLTEFSTEKKIREKYPDIIIIKDEFNIKDLISNSNGIITINSQTGVEALLLGKNVLVLGNSYYSNKGLTLDYKGHTLIELVKKLIYSKFYVNKDTLSKLLFYLKNNELYETNIDETNLKPKSYEKLKKVLTYNMR